MERPIIFAGFSNSSRISDELCLLVKSYNLNYQIIVKSNSQAMALLSNDEPLTLIFQSKLKGKCIALEKEAITGIIVNKHLHPHQSNIYLWT